jgi:hypothetical protein
VDVDGHPGRKGGLTVGEEEGLVDFLVKMSEAGLGVTTGMLKERVRKMVGDGREHQFGPSGPTDQWVQLFLSKHRLSLRKVEALSSDRSKVTREIAQGYLEKVGLKRRWGGINMPCSISFSS